MWLLITFSGSLEPDLHRVLLSFLSASLLFNPRHRKTWVSLKRRWFLSELGMFVTDFIYSWEIGSAVLPHFSMGGKKGNVLSTQEQEGHQAPINATILFPRKARSQAKPTFAHPVFDSQCCCTRVCDRHQRPCPGHAQHLRTVTAKCALHRAPLIGVRAPARLPPRFTSQFGHRDAFHGVCCGTSGSLSCSAPDKAQGRISLLGVDGAGARGRRTAALVHGAGREGEERGHGPDTSC